MAGGENRRKLKGLLKKMMGMQATNPDDSPAPANNGDNNANHTASHQEDERKIDDQAARAPTLPTERQSDEEKTNKKEPTDTKPISEDKVAKHWLKAKKGVLKKATQLGDGASLADLHDHSEKRYFIGHQRFSQLMEELVDEGLIDYNWDAQEATVTDNGLDFIKA